MASDYPILNGVPGVVEGEIRYLRDQNGAVTTVRTWLGYKDDLVTHASTLIGQYELSQVSGPVYRLSLTQAGMIVGGNPVTDPNEMVVTVWDLKVQQQRRDLWEHPKFRIELEKIQSVEGRARFLADLKALCNGEVVTYTADENGVVTNVQLTIDAVLTTVVLGAGVNADVVLGFANEMARGVDSYLYDTFVVTKKRVGPAAATNLIPSFSSTNLPITTSTLLNSEPSMPNSIRAPIAFDLSAGFWLRNADELNQLNTDQVEVNTQWVFGWSYSSIIYAV